MTADAASRFSLVAFALALVTVGVGTAAGLRFVPVVGASLGTLAGAFVVGLATETRPTVEAGLAAAVAGLGVLVAATLPGNGVVEAVLALGSVDPVTLVTSVALSFAVGAFGGHFGDDVRDGLTEPVEPSGPRPTAGGGAPGTRASATESADAELTRTASPEADADVDDARRKAASTDGDEADAGPTEGRGDAGPTEGRGDAGPTEGRGDDGSTQFELE